MLPFENIILIDKKSSIAVYKQIANSIINTVRNGVLKPGTKLPGSREMASILNVHRKTVIASYDELEAQGWITVFPRKYVMVAEKLPLLHPKKWDETELAYSYDNDLKINFRIIDKSWCVERDTVEIIIDDGHPDVRLSPIDELLKTYRSFTSRQPAIKSANKGTAQGTVRLREEMVKFLSITRGLTINTDNILITHGAQMSIYLAAQLLLNTQSTIIVGKPNYTVANETFIQTGTQLIEVSVDEYGINTDQIEQLCKKKKITAVYVIPHHHYPTTVTLSVERRMKLLELSNRYSFVIIEDDYDYDYHYASSPYLPLASANHQGNVIYIGSFSKLLDPSLRIGFMAAPKNFIVQCTALRKMIDVGGDGYMQNALAELIKTGELKRHLNKTKKIYHNRRDFLNDLLQSQLSEYISFTVPNGGMAVWITLRKDYSVKQLQNTPLLKIIRTDEESNSFRLGFASMNEQEIEITIDLLHNLLKKQ
ncbi:PLP-dependent aminotransferase family protein [Epilithonimonas zeae]|uniref:MocR-like pyridoxine biosynthesis transcription factor PdxR n=1 Tax=Epilithonimonas zeae TaxID=1416779 RepID=UPI00200EEB3E|nr:PLP-dependent aminotransferase family protein [Epilithonimonas zeae]UQB69352.1 PLP-dependent aminotransferase family protein [Epilithonimonas zeae]